MGNSKKTEFEQNYRVVISDKGSSINSKQGVSDNVPTLTPEEAMATLGLTMEEIETMAKGANKKKPVGLFQKIENLLLN